MLFRGRMTDAEYRQALSVLPHEQGQKTQICVALSNNSKQN